ncbi:MAG: M15 family metallopeptidase [Actinomycetota bacterium]
MVIGAVGLLVISRVGTSTTLGETTLVVLGTLVSYILLPEQPARFWRVRSTDLAATVPPSDLQNAVREAAKALAIQTGGSVGPASAALLWNDAVQSVSRAIGDPTRIVIDMDYRISVTDDHGRQLVRTCSGGKRCWPGTDQVFFSYCSDIDALSAEYASTREGSIAREVVEPDAGEDLGDWQRRVACYPVVLVIDGKEYAPVNRETRRLSGSSMSHRVVFDVTESRITDAFTPMQLTTEFHQKLTDRQFIVKFSNYSCIGSTRLAFEVDDPSAIVEVNDFMLDASLELEFHKRSGIAACQVALQTREDSVLRPGSGVVFNWDTGNLLAEPPTRLQQDSLPEGRPLPDPPQLPTELPRNKGLPEPLAKVAGLRCIDAYSRLGISRQRRVPQVREGVLRRLHQAQSDLPSGFEFVVLDGWRSPSFQQMLVDHYGTSSTGRYVADPESLTMRPPHVVGGAVDLTLGYEGTPLALGSNYDDFSLKAHFDAFELNDTIIRRLRRMMAQALLDNDFAPYPFEWWHWSYGDDVWASFKGTQSLYDVIADEE